MINFDNLPDSISTNSNNNFKLLSDGWYTFTIKAADMRQPHDANKPPYMNLQLHSDTGTVFDIITESDKPLAQYKLKQFIKALQINLKGEFELSDLPKIVVGKTVQACVSTDTPKNYPARNIINVFQDGGYRPVEDDADLPWNNDSPFTGEAESY